MNDSVFLRRVVLSNYKSIKSCSVNLGSLVFLVGPNGAGKSNFLDALRLVSESLNTSLEHAFRERGGINEVRRRPSGRTGRATHFGIRLEFRLPSSTVGMYAFRVGALEKGGFQVQHEECAIFPEGGALKKHFYRVEGGEKTLSSFKLGPRASSDRLFLVAASGLPEFRPIYDALSHMGFYNLNPDEIRDLQPPDPGNVLYRDGRNLASVLSLMARDKKEAREQVVKFLSKVVPGVRDVKPRRVAQKETLEFFQEATSKSSTWRFLAESMSDGTLRALGVLTAVFQAYNGGGDRVPLVGIEEPEMAVHPGAAGVLRDALRVASSFTQIIVTSHSPDLLDDKSVNDSEILAVANQNGETQIAPPSQAGREAIRKKLYTAGELLRLDQLQPDAAEIDALSQRQLGLFADYTP